MTEEQALKLFKGLADRSRLQILKSLLEEDMYVERLAQRLELSAWADYPLYLPNPKPLCLLAIPAAQLREEMYG